MEIIMQGTRHTAHQDEHSTARRGSVKDRRNVAGLQGLLERIARTDGPINPNDRATARLYAEFLKTNGHVPRESDHVEQVEELEHH